MAIKKKEGKKRNTTALLNQNNIKLQQVNTQLSATIDRLLDQNRAKDRQIDELLRRADENGKFAPATLTADGPVRHVTGCPNSDQVQFSTGAVRRATDNCALELIPLEALEGYGHRLHYGAVVRGYGPRNWEKGIPYANLIQHAQRHISKGSQQLTNFVAELANHPLPKESLGQSYATDLDGELIDSLYGNMCAAFWNIGAVITFLRRGNPAERK